MSREVELNFGLVALIDESDFELVAQYQWRAHRAFRPDGTLRTAYAATRSRNHSRIFMHHLILPKQDGMLPDHINGNGLDNRRSNLRRATPSENVINRRTETKAQSGFRGVHWAADKGRWKVQIRVAGRNRHIGYFEDAEVAARARDAAVLAVWGDFAVLNFPDVKAPVPTRPFCASPSACVARGLSHCQACHARTNTPSRRMAA